MLLLFQDNDVFSSTVQSNVLSNSLLHSPAIRQWWLAIPTPALFTQLPRFASLLRPVESSLLSLDRNGDPTPPSSDWSIVTSSDDILNLDNYVSPETNLALVAVPFVADREKDVFVLLGSDGPIEVFAHGESQFVRHRAAPFRLQQVSFRITLQRGINYLVFKVVRGSSFRIAARLRNVDREALTEVHPVLTAGFLLAPQPPPIIAVAGTVIQLPLGVELASDAVLSLMGLPDYCKLTASPEQAAIEVAPSASTPSMELTGFIDIKQSGHVARAPLPLVVTRSALLEVTPPFDALPGSLYPLFARIGTPTGRRLELSSHAAWSVRSVDYEASATLFYDGDGHPLLKTERAGKVMVAAQYGALSNTISVEITDRPQRAFRRATQNISTLIAAYVDPSRPVQALKETQDAVKNAQEFIYRNTLGELVLQPEIRTFSGTIPQKRHSYWRGLERHLRQESIPSGTYGLIVALGRAKGPCFGGKTLRGSAAAYCSVLSMRYVVHEIQHSIDNVMALGSGFGEMHYGHGYTEPSVFGNGQYPVSAGRHDAWEAAVLRAFTHYRELLPPWNHEQWFVDSDGDGLADDDGELPMDEKRWGSNPFAADTDADGLSDWQEYVAGIYGGTDPTSGDTDRDGLSDSLDSYPLVNLANGAHVRRLSEAPTIDGRLDPQWPLLIRGHNDSGQCLNRSGSCGQAMHLEVFAGVQKQALFLAVKLDVPFSTVVVNLDGSPENGPWLGGDFHVVWADRSNKRLFKGQGELPDDRRNPTEIPESEAAYLAVGGHYILEARIPMQLGKGYGWDHHFLDSPLREGIRLEPLSAIGLNLRITTSKGQITPGEEETFFTFVVE